MSAIEAISQGCTGTLKDGTLKYEIRIDPKYRAAASELFGEPGSPVVVARLTGQAAIQSAQAETIADHIADAGKMVPKGGALAKLAGQWCNLQSFYDWIRPVYDNFLGDIGPEFYDTRQEYCRHCLLVMCDIDSRVELDHDPIAADKFHRLVRLPYAEYLKESA